MSNYPVIGINAILNNCSAAVPQKIKPRWTLRWRNVVSAACQFAFVALRFRCDCKIIFLRGCSSIYSSTQFVFFLLLGNHRASAGVSVCNLAYFLWWIIDNNICEPKWIPELLQVHFSKPGHLDPADVFHIKVTVKFRVESHRWWKRLRSN